MKSEVVSFSKFLNDKSLDYPKIKTGDYKIEEIMTDFQKLSLHYIKEQINFRKTFTTLKEAEALIEQHKKIFNDLLSLSNQARQTNNFGKFVVMEELNTKVLDNYQQITEFLDLCTTLRGDE